jgi:hypothetical protein
MKGACGGIRSPDETEQPWMSYHERVRGEKFIPAHDLPIGCPADAASYHQVSHGGSDLSSRDGHSGLTSIHQIKGLCECASPGTCPWTHPRSSWRCPEAIGRWSLSPGQPHRPEHREPRGRRRSDARGQACAGGCVAALPYTEAEGLALIPRVSPGNGADRQHARARYPWS